MMRSAMALPERRYSLDDYFLVELSSPLKHEYLRGEIFAMSGASSAHNEITANVLTLLRTALRGGPCRAYASDLRVATPSGLFTYPDLAVVCGPVELIPERPDTATNPALLIEVLSHATRTYDRGQKFAAYKTLPSLKEYVLVEQDRVEVEHWHRRRASWTSRTVTRLSATLALPTIGIRVPLREIYRDVAAVRQAHPAKPSVPGRSSHRGRR
jgi:Uma2 family endonuclease